MMRCGKSLIVLALLSALIVLNPLPVLADAIVSIQTRDSTPNVGSSFDVFVDISNVNDLFAFQFDISFNPAVISAVSVTEGTFLPSGGATSFFAGSIDNINGSISFTADSLTGAIPGVTGDGTLTDITFQALSGSISPIDLSNILLLDSMLSDVAFSSTGDTVSPISSVPEPSTMLFLGPVLIGLVGFRRRLRK